MNENAEVNAWLAELEHPPKDVILEGEAKSARYARCPDLGTVDGRRDELGAVVRACCNDREKT